MGETWVNTEMRAKAEIMGRAELGTRASTRTGDGVQGEAVMGTGARAGFGPWV